MPAPAARFVGVLAAVSAVVAFVRASPRAARMDSLVLGDPSIMRQRANGRSTERAPQGDLLWGADASTADRICTRNRHYAEHSGYFRTTTFLDEVASDGETGIGLFPDVGGGWHLPRLPGESGIWLALTGARLKAAECLSLGIASHYVPAESLPELKAALLAGPSNPQAIVELFASDPGPAKVDGNRERIDRLFAFDTMEEIFAALEADVFL